MATISIIWDLKEDSIHGYLISGKLLWKNGLSLLVNRVYQTLHYRRLPITFRFWNMKKECTMCHIRKEFIWGLLLRMIVSQILLTFKMYDT